MSAANNGSPIEILLVEDNPGDVELARRVLRDSKVANRVTVASDGVAAMEALQRSQRRPDLIILDINLPRKSGLEVLAEIKQDLRLTRIPVLVVSSSKAEEDVRRTYDLHADGYLSKPVGLDEYRRMVRSIESFWFGLARL